MIRNNIKVWVEMIEEVAHIYIQSNCSREVELRIISAIGQLFHIESNVQISLQDTYTFSLSMKGWPLGNYEVAVRESETLILIEKFSKKEDEDV